MAEMDLERKKQDLIQMLERDESIYEKRRKQNRIWANALMGSTILAGLIAVGGGTTGAIQNSGELGIMSAIAGGLVVLLRLMDRSFPWGERADFFRRLAFECKNLVVAIRLEVVDREKFNIILEKYKELSKRATMKVPRGQGMQLVKELYEDMDERGTIKVPRELLFR